MGILSWLGYEKRSTVSVSDQNFWQKLTGRASSPTVTVDNSFGIPALWAAYRILHDTMASLPFEVFEKSGKSVNPAEALPLYDLLTSEPNTIQDAFTWKGIMQVNLESYGNAFSRIHRSRMGVVEHLEWYHPDQVTILVNASLSGPPGPNTIKYKIRAADVSGRPNEIILDYDEVIHLKIMSRDGIIGRSPILACREVLSGMISAQEYSTQYYANGASPSAVLTSPAKNMTKEQYDEIIRKWEGRHNPNTGVNKVALLYAGTTYEQISSTPVDADWIKTIKLNSEQIAQIFGIPQHLLGNLERSTNNNIEQQSIDFVRNCVRPRAKLWEVECNRKFFLEAQNKKKYFVRYNLEGLLRGDTEARSAFYQTLVTLRMMTRNEGRALENMNPVEGGDEFDMPVNLLQPNPEPKPSENGNNSQEKAKQNGKIAA